MCKRNKKVKKLTLEQGIIITGATGFTCVDFSKFHEDVENRLGRPVFTQEFANAKFAKKIKEMYLDDLKSIVLMVEKKK